MKRMSSIITLVIVLVIIIGGGAYIMKRGGFSGGIIEDSGDNLSDFSAVFVNGGGIYFGKITKLTDSVLSMEEVYNYGVVPATDANGKTTTTAGQTDTKPTLFDASKVGIAPASRYNINREQVILWYSLKNDSDVVKTITSYKAQ